MSPWKHIQEYRIGFKSERDEMNRPHVHIGNDRGAAKFWLNPVRLAENHFRSEYELQRAEKVVIDFEEEFLKMWQDYFRNSLDDSQSHGSSLGRISYSA